jgi:chemotaxis protein CheD
MISVGMGEIKLSTEPDEVLCALGLGSCVGVCMYDWQLRLGGMCHVVLPSSSAAKDSSQEPGRYADTAIPLLLSEMQARGAQTRRIGLAVAGGAELFKMAQSEGSVLNIGARNAQAVEEALRALGLQAAAIDVGGNFGRSLSLNVADGEVRVRTLGLGETILAELSPARQPVAAEKAAA